MAPARVMEIILVMESSIKRWGSSSYGDFSRYSGSNRAIVTL